MAHKVREVMTENPVMLEMKDTLVEAARKMRDEDIGDVLVMKDGKLCGTVTDRDITVRPTAAGKDPNQVTLGDICSQELVTISADRPVSEAVSLMRNKTLGDLAVELDERSVLASISAPSPTPDGRMGEVAL